MAVACGVSLFSRFNLQVEARTCLRNNTNIWSRIRGGNGKTETLLSIHLQWLLLLDKVDGLSLIRNSTCRAVVCVALISAAAALVGCGNAYRATISTNNPTPVPTEPLYLPVVLSSAGSSSQGAVTLFESPGEGAMLDLSGDTVLDLVNVGIAPVALAEGTGGGIAYAVDLGSTVSPYIPAVSSFVITPSTQTASVSTTALNTGATIFTPLAPTQPTPCIAATPPPAVFANAALIVETNADLDFCGR